MGGPTVLAIGTGCVEVLLVIARVSLDMKIVVVCGIPHHSQPMEKRCTDIAGYA